MTALSPTVSVVLTPSREPNGLVATRASIAAQRGVDYEVIECPATTDSSSELAMAIGAARGEFVTFIDPGDHLRRDALARLAEAIEDSVDMIYSDEDVLDDGIHRDPFFKPDWSLDRVRAQHYTGRLAAYRRDVLTSLGGVRTDLLDAFEHDLVLRFAERSAAIVHIPSPLYHRAPRARSFLAPSADGRSAIQEHLERVGAQLSVALSDDGESYRLLPAVRDRPLVSIIIPTAGTSRVVNGQRTDLVVNCVTSIIDRSTYDNYEIVCVADTSTPPHVMDAIRRVGKDRVQIVPYGLPFNFSHKVNTGVLTCNGNYLVLLNDDTEVMTPEWLEVLLSYASDPGVGAVGLMLHFPGGRIQHAGVVSSEGNPGHPFYGFNVVRARGYFGNLTVPCNYLAVTAACLMTRRTCFEEVGGLSLRFHGNYNDIDYGIKLFKSGYRNVFTPEATLLHYESASRGTQRVEDDELDLLNQRWGGVLDRDPFYNPNFLPGADFRTLVVPDGRTPAELKTRPLT